MFNYQGSSLFLFSRSNSDILSCCFLFVKNFFVFLFAVCFGSVSPSQVSFNRLSHPLPSVKNFFHFVQRSALASCPTVALGLVLFIGLSQRQVVYLQNCIQRIILFPITLLGYALDLLVTVSSMCYHTSTSALSTSSSSRGLTNLTLWDISS